MSRRTAESNKAILVAWSKEQELVQEGKGTREWTLQQQQDILEKGKAYDDNGKAFEGQHMKSAEMYPEYQGEPGNIQFLTRAEHLEAHDGNWQNPTNWYYNPVTKEKFDFGDGPFIPCEIIQLSMPIIEVQDEQVHETIKVQKLETTANKEASHENIISKSTAVKAKPKLRFRERLKLDFKKFSKIAVEFSVKHPTAVKVIQEVGMVTVTTLVVAVAESFKNGSMDSGHNSFDDFYNECSDNVSDECDDYSDDVPDAYDDYTDNVSTTDKGYTPNDVPAGKQRYHYKDGSVKWVDKKSYHRGGNKDE